MKKSVVMILLVLTAAAASAATIGVQKLAGKLGEAGGLLILTDERCKDCDTGRIESALKVAFPESPVSVVDYGQRRGRKLYESEGVEKLPAALIPRAYSEKESFKRFERFAKLGKDYYLLSTGGKFDPKAEICDNGKDDNGDGLVDCEDPACKADWRCMEKRDRPDVDVFVMSHCPFGTQIEKGLLPVWDLFGDKIDLNIRFVGYAMHGKREVDEQLKQHCVAAQGKGKFRKYLECFLRDGAESDRCDKEAKVDAAALAACIRETDRRLGVTAGLEDKSKWMGRFPPFPIDAELGEKYGVRGSPTVVINDAVVQSGRSPKALRDAICMGFKEKPEECAKEMDDSTPSPGFGLSKGAGPGGKASAAKCGD
ncbi:MAG: hypothetical protein JXA24_06500 [Proteobacteria bacterium]|nr:hypothetical protein [Pseudomonadota bacterium]